MWAISIGTDAAFTISSTPRTWQTGRPDQIFQLFRVNSSNFGLITSESLR